MTDTPRRPGPWDIEPGSPPSTSQPFDETVGPADDKGQGWPWAILSTLLLGAFVWWVTHSWLVAVALIFGLFVHEYGHVLAMNRLGMGPARIYIIPFLGGLARARRNPSSEWHGILVSLAGPAFGLLASIPFFGLWQLTGGTAWLTGAFAIALINLVNLAPAPPLDGAKALGPILARVHPALEWSALLLTGGLVVWWGFANGSFLFAAFLGIALLGHLRRGRWRPYGRALTWAEAGMGTLMFAATAFACLAVAAAAVLPLGDGSLFGGVNQGGRFLGLTR